MRPDTIPPASPDRVSSVAIGGTLIELARDASGATEVRLSDVEVVP